MQVFSLPSAFACQTATLDQTGNESPFLCPGVEITPLRSGRASMALYGLANDLSGAQAGLQR